MEIEYRKLIWKGEEIVRESISDYLYEQLLYSETYSGSERVRLENQPKVVCEALGRLVSRLLDKNILDLADLHAIAQTYYGRIHDTAELKKEEPPKD